MNKQLRILLLEHLASDAELIEREMRKGNLAFSLRRVETEEAFVRALEEFRPNLVLADYSPPSFDGLSALAITQKKCPQEIEALSRFPSENANPVLRVTADGTILYANNPAREIFKAQVGKKVPEYYLPILKKAISSEQYVSFEQQVSGRYYSSVVKHVPEAGYCNIYSRDITERKKAETLIKEQNERLKELDRMKSEFLSTAAHELRTPLTSILGFSEILLKRKLDEEKRNKFLKIINEEAQGLASLINDLLDVSRIESGKGFEIKKKRADIRKTILKNVDSFKSKTDKHTFKVNIPSHPVRIEVDKNRIDQVMENLLSNAVKFSPKGGKIGVFLEQTEGEIKISISDTGIGIQKKDLPHIFEKFYRVDDASTQAIGGAGLGLSICKYIIESHAGVISGESRFYKGSTFSFTLPLKSIREEDEKGRSHEEGSNS